MTDFRALRTFLEERQTQFAKAVENPNEFEQEFIDLQKSWQHVGNQAVLREITERAMRKYPPVWQALLAARLVQQAQLPKMNEVIEVVSPHVVASQGFPTEENSRQSFSKSEIVPQTAQFQPSENGGDSTQPRMAETVSGGERTLQEQHTSRRMQDRLAIWDKKIAIGKEIVTGIMGVAIIVVTLIVVFITIFSVNNTQTYAAAKDVLLFLNGLVGVVLGYYFGRVPGEVRAEKAENEAREAKSDLDRTVGEIRSILDEGAVATDRRENGEITLTAAQVEHLRRFLRQH